MGFMWLDHGIPIEAVADPLCALLKLLRMLAFMLQVFAL